MNPCGSCYSDATAMSNAQSVDSAEDAVKAKLQAFIDTIEDSETYQQFVEASERVEVDREAMELLET